MQSSQVQHVWVGVCFSDHMQLHQMTSLWMELKPGNLCDCVWGRLQAWLGGKVRECPAGSCLVGMRRGGTLSLNSRARSSSSLAFCLHLWSRYFSLLCPVRGLFPHMLSSFPRLNPHLPCPSLPKPFPSNQQSQGERSEVFSLSGDFF